MEYLDILQCEGWLAHTTVPEHHNAVPEVEDDDEDSDDDDDDDTGDDDDDFVNDDYLHLLHWHKATGQMWKQIILSNVRWILFWEDILQIRIHIKNTYGHMVSYDRKVMFCNNIC